MRKTSFIAAAAVAGFAASSASYAGDVAPIAPVRPVHSAPPVGRASLIPSICSPSDVRKGLCRMRVIEPDPYDRLPNLSAEEHNSRGINFMVFGLISTAITEFSAAIREKPDYAEAYNNRGTLYYALHDFVRAMADYNQALQLSPNYPDPFFNRAQLLNAEGKFEAALRDYDRYLELKPEDMGGYMGRAYAHRQLRQYDAALADLNRVIRARPADAEAYNARCWTRAIAGLSLSKALSDCNKSLALDRTCQTLDSRGFVYFRLGKMKHAIADNTEALKINPGLASALYIRGLARTRIGDTTGGGADIAAATALDPTLPGVYAAYGVTP